MRSQLFILFSATLCLAQPASAQAAKSYLTINKAGGACAPATLRSRNADRAILATINVHVKSIGNTGQKEGDYEVLRRVAAGGSVSLGCTFEQLGPPASLTTWKSYSILGAVFQ